MFNSGTQQLMNTFCQLDNTNLLRYKHGRALNGHSLMLVFLFGVQAGESLRRKIDWVCRTVFPDLHCPSVLHTAIIVELNVVMA